VGTEKGFGDAKLLAGLTSAAAGVAEDTMARIYRKHGGAVMRFAAQCTGDTVLAEQVTQDVFVHLWCNPHSFHAPEISLQSHLAKTAYWRCVAKLALEEYRGHLEQEVETDPWRQLRAEERWALGLTHFGRMTSKEVAAVLGVSEDVVKCRISRGLQRLREAGVEAQNRSRRPN